MTKKSLKIAVVQLLGVSIVPAPNPSCDMNTELFPPIYLYVAKEAVYEFDAESVTPTTNILFFNALGNGPVNLSRSYDARFGHPRQMDVERLMYATIGSKVVSC